jgi:hypothetical protein
MEDFKMFGDLGLPEMFILSILSLIIPLIIIIYLIVLFRRLVRAVEKISENSIKKE